MNDKKYEITDIAHPQYPWLYRIRALRDIRDNVHAGELGGFIQYEDNLSHDGSCWIFDNAAASEEACVSGNAILQDNACATGSASVSGDTLISGSAFLNGNAIITSGRISGSAYITGNAVIRKSSITDCSPLIDGGAYVYGEVCGKVAIHKNFVVLPGLKIDNPTHDLLHIFPDRAVVERAQKSIFNHNIVSPEKRSGPER